MSLKSETPDASYFRGSELEGEGVSDFRGSEGRERCVSDFRGSVEVKGCLIFQRHHTSMHVLCDLGRTPYASVLVYHAPMHHAPCP